MAHDYPILEFDPTPEALIEPKRVIRPRDTPEHCIVCFFREVIEKVCGDDVSGEVWADRDWRARASVRERLFWLAAEACLSL